MPYCLTCGRLSETEGGMCKQCRADFAVSRKRVNMAPLPDKVTLPWIRDHGARLNTRMSRVFARAATRAMHGHR